MLLLRRLMWPGVCALGIVANHGLDVLNMASCRPHSQCWTFEPTQAPHSLRTASVCDNGFGARIIVVPPGLAERDCEAEFSACDHSDLSHRDCGCDCCCCAGSIKRHEIVHSRYRQFSGQRVTARVPALLRTNLSRGH